jgi:hypothetical protein
MSLLALVSNLTSAAGADAVVEHIFSTHYTHPGGEAAYLTTVFNQDVRRTVFDGGVLNGRSVILSSKAQLLKAALQRRHLQSNGTRFTPHHGYHITSSHQIAAIIAKTGFRSFPGNYGQGAYFFGSSQSAENYEALIHVGADGQPVAPVVIEVIYYSRLASGHFPTGSDEVTFFFRPKDIYLLKNPLVVFPTAVFERGHKFANVGVDL